MNLVVDACVAMKWFAPENLHDEALWLLRHASDRLVAPDCFLLELANTVRKKRRNREIDSAAARRIVSEMAGSGIPAIVPVRPLVERVLDFALLLDHGAYDCAYLACAEALDAVVVTADRPFFAKLADTSFSDLMCFLGDPGWTTRLDLPALA